MDLFPLFLKLQGRRVLVVGDEAVVGPAKRDALRARRRADVRQRTADAFTDADLDGAWLVVAAGPPGLNARIARLAEVRRFFVNAVDVPPIASSYLGGVVGRDGVTIAISTSGAAPKHPGGAAARRDRRAAARRSRSLDGRRTRCAARVEVAGCTDGGAAAAAARRAQCPLSGGRGGSPDPPTSASDKWDLSLSSGLDRATRRC